MFCSPSHLVITFCIVLHDAVKGIVHHRPDLGWLVEADLGGCFGIIPFSKDVFLDKIVSDHTPGAKKQPPNQSVPGVAVTSYLSKLSTGSGRIPQMVLVPARLSWAP